VALHEALVRLCTRLCPLAVVEALRAREDILRKDPI